MAPRLRYHALPGINQNDRQVGGGGAGRHVARVLFVAGRIGDDEFALRRREEAVGYVDRDALLALGFEPVDQQCEIDVVAGRAMLPGIALQRGELILEYLPGIGQQAANQRRLAVVDRAAGQESEQRLALLPGKIVSHVFYRCHAFSLDMAHAQKYPSRFFFSIEPASSRSMRRPWRSDVLAVSISLTMPSRLSASESIAPVSG